MAAVEAREIVDGTGVIEAVDINDRLDELREAENEYAEMIGRMNAAQEAEYIRIVREIARLEREKKRQMRPSLFQRLSTMVTGRTSARVDPIEATPVARFID